MTLNVSQQATNWLKHLLAKKAKKTNSSLKDVIIPANKEVQESEDVKKDALAQAVITMGSSDTYTTVMPKLSQMSVFWTESAAILSDAYNGKFGEDQYLAKLQQFDKDLAAAK